MYIKKKMQKKETGRPKRSPRAYLFFILQQHKQKMKRTAVFLASDSDSYAQAQGDIKASGRLEGPTVTYGDAQWDTTEIDLKLAGISKERRELHKELSPWTSNQISEKEGRLFDIKDELKNTALTANKKQTLRDEKAALKADLEKIPSSERADELETELEKLDNEARQLREDEAIRMVRSGFDAREWLKMQDTNLKTAIAQEYQTLRPPYAPSIESDELQSVLNWVAAEEEQRKAVNEDPVYRFVYKVAGYTGDTVERMIKRDVNKRRSTNAFLDVPGADIEQMLDKTKKKVDQMIAANSVKLSKQRAFDRMKRQVDYIASSQSIRELTMYKGDDSIVLNDLSVLDDVGSTIGGKDMENLRAYMESSADRLPQDYSNLEATPLLGARVDDKSVNDFENVETVAPFIRFHLYEGYTLVKDDVIDTEESIALSLEEKRLQKISESITIASMRERKAASLDWLERSEVMKTADMNEELYMAVDQATNLILTRVPGMALLLRMETNGHPEEILINSSNRAFGSYFANLTGNLIRDSRFFSGQRSSFDRNHARLTLMNDRLIRALSRFSYFNGKIVSEDETELMGQERIAYM